MSEMSDQDRWNEEAAFEAELQADQDWADAQADADWAAEVFHVTKSGTFEHGLSTLQLRGAPDAARLASVSQRLLEVRSARFAPPRDDKVVASWNGLAIDALVTAALVFGERPWLDLAVRAAQVVRPTAPWRRCRRAGAQARPAQVGAVPVDAASSHATPADERGDGSRVA